jgi:hypothetical protein
VCCTRPPQLLPLLLVWRCAMLALMSRSSCH